MRFIHTADWHLGRSFNNTSLIEDQVYVLDQLIDLAKESRPEIVLISGDVYDRAIPPTDAVKLLDETLTRLVLDLGLRVILIAGNHDSPLRLQFGARLLESLKLYLFGTLSEQLKFIQLYDTSGTVGFYAMPYAEPAVVREHYKDEQISNHEHAIRAWIDRVKRSHPPGGRSVLIAHAFITGAEESKSERPLSVGGSGTVSATCFEGFNYVALGHLHRPQSLGSGQIHYSGSLLKYSFSEATHTKSVNLVEMDSRGNCRVERIPIRAKRDVRCIDGTMEDLLRGPIEVGSREDYIKVRLLDPGVILDPMGRLREVYPNVLELERTGLMGEPGEERPKRDHRKTDVVSLFADFFSQVTGEAPNQEQASAFASVVDSMQQEEREASL